VCLAGGSEPAAPAPLGHGLQVAGDDPEVAAARHPHRLRVIHDLQREAGLLASHTV
jgi:hypothetical protein